MSSNETQAALSRAYELVEAGQYDQARAILDPILAANPNNADAWWVYAHAVTTPEDGRAALENVIRIDPRYPGAVELLQQARELSPVNPGDSSAPMPPGTFPEESPLEPDFLDSEFEDVESIPPVPSSQPGRQQPAGTKRSSALPIVALALIAAVVVIAILVLPGLSTTTETPTPTSEDAVVIAPTDIPASSATDEITEAAPVADVTPETVQETTESPTVEVATAEAVPANYSAVNDALSAFPLASAGIVETQTSLGNTVLANVCSASGREMRMLLPQVMNALASQSPSLPETVQAVGVRLVNCESNAPMLSVATEIVSAQSFAQGDLSAGEFAATWQPQ